ncbi:hypothetical protein V6N13_043275 [Hibiscus sabdariffa]
MCKSVSHLPKFSAMNLLVLFLLSSLFVVTFSLKPEPTKNNNAQITVMGLVYCDICYNNSFSRHNYFLPGLKYQQLTGSNVQRQPLHHLARQA